MPTGAMLSPPESPVGSDDEVSEARRIEKREQALDELKKAVSVIPQPSSSSRYTPPEDLQKPSHNRSRSEIIFTSRPESNAVSDTEEDPPRVAPPMVRKKSGEIVKSSLKHSHRPRPVSMPSTPTYPKVVHFDQHLEHVRHFNFQEKPAAVSATSSPVEQLAHHGYPFPGEDRMEWDIELPNFPADSPARKALPVRLERTYMSTDKQSLLGSIAVANLAFQKSVVVRFTLDYWRTVSEVTAEFSNDVRRRQKEDGMDRFTFCIGLGDQVNLHKKTLFFCVRYTVAGQEFWDNNNGLNFQVDFKQKKVVQQPMGFPPPLGALPRSKSAVNLSTRQQRSQTIDDSHTGSPFRPTGLEWKHENDDFRNAISFKSEPFELSKKKPEVRRPSEDDNATIPVRKTAPANAFSNRYDFGASLSATIKGSKQEKRSSKKSEDLSVNINGSPVPKTAASKRQTDGRGRSGAVPQSGSLQGASYRFADEAKSSSSGAASSAGAASAQDSGLRSFVNAAGVGKPPIQSLSYRELLDNYCFFGSARTSPDGSYTDLFSLRDQPKQSTNLPAYTLVSPHPSSPSSHQQNHHHHAGLEMGQHHRHSTPPSPSRSPTLRWSPIASPSPKGSTPSLTGSPQSSGSTSPIAILPPNYNFQRRRHGGGVGGFAFDATAAATAIRG